MRARRVLRIRREDHIGDPVAVIFMDPASQDQDAIIARLRAYLGNGVRILRADVGREEVEVEVESSRYFEEASQLAGVAADLAQKGAPRNAQALFKEALEIDPLNPDAYLGLGLLLAARERFSEALAALRRAREVCAEQASAEVLLALAHCCSRCARLPDAVSYLNQAAALAPNNPAIRRALAALGGKAPQAQVQAEVRPPRKVALLRNAERNNKRRK